MAKTVAKGWQTALRGWPATPWRDLGHLLRGWPKRWPRSLHGVASHPLRAVCHPLATVLATASGGGQMHFGHLLSHPLSHLLRNCPTQPILFFWMIRHLLQNHIYLINRNGNSLIFQCMLVSIVEFSKFLILHVVYPKKKFTRISKQNNHFFRNTSMKTFEHCPRKHYTYVSWGANQIAKSASFFRRIGFNKSETVKNGL